MNSMQCDREIHEAIHAADDALDALRRAQSCLSSAGNWGILDLLGGSFFSTMFKHDKIERAQAELENARAALRRFRGELADLGRSAEIDLEIGDFLYFADFFFDGAVADWLVQSKIRKGERQVRQAIAQVEEIRRRLWEMLR